MVNCSLEGEQHQRDEVSDESIGLRGSMFGLAGGWMSWRPVDPLRRHASKCSIHVQFYFCSGGWHTRHAVGWQHWQDCMAIKSKECVGCTHGCGSRTVSYQLRWVRYPELCGLAVCQEFCSNGIAWYIVYVELYSGNMKGS